MISEKIARKEQMITAAVNQLRRVVRRNGAPISPSAGIAQVAEHVLDVDPGRVMTMWQDIITIDTVKNAIIKFGVSARWPQMTTEEILEYDVNDERLTADGKSWAVVKITRQGAQILTCGGDYYRKYQITRHATEVTGEDGSTEIVYTDEFKQAGSMDILESTLRQSNAAWLAETFEAEVNDTLDTYSEDGNTYLVVPCTLPGDLLQLVDIQLQCSAVDGSGSCPPLSYQLSNNTCDDTNPGMLGLPHGMWLIYDNSALASAPQALLIPRDLAFGTTTGMRIDRVRIRHDAYVSGLARLRLVGDSFGEEYIVSTQDAKLLEGAWRE